MNKSQLIDALAARFEGNKKAAAHALESVLDTITREVAKGDLLALRHHYPRGGEGREGRDHRFWFVREASS